MAVPVSSPGARSGFCQTEFREKLKLQFSCVGTKAATERVVNCVDVGECLWNDSQKQAVGQIWPIGLYKLRFNEAKPRYEWGPRARPWLVHATGAEEALSEECGLVAAGQEASQGEHKGELNGLLAYTPVRTAHAEPLVDHTCTGPVLMPSQCAHGPEEPPQSWDYTLVKSDGVSSFHTDDQDRKKNGQPGSPSPSHLAYGILDTPPWYLCIFLGIQHFLTALGGLVAVPLILAKDLCLQHDPLTQSYLISTIFFVSGLCTLLQVFLGIRLPILQGGTFAFLAPSLAMLSLPAWKCPEWTLNASQVNTSSPEFTEEWQKRIRELQGAIMVASCVQMLVGFSGLIGFLLRFIGPLTIAPTIALVALPLFDSAGADAGIHWGISALTSFLIVLFSQYLKNVAVPVPVYGEKGRTSKFYLFQVFPVLLALCLSWLFCFVLTITDTLPVAPSAYGYLARTDTKGSVLSQAPWFRFPYPGQWGLPTLSLAGVFGIIAGVISSMVESVGDYYACARLVGAPPPPKHAVNRGIGIEGLGCLLAGAWGTGNGTTSYSENVGALGVTRVGSRMVIVAAGCVLLLMGVFGKIGAAFATIPTPVIGGMFLVMFGVITAVGISNLQYADMNSSRNLFVFGFSIYCGLAIPSWANRNPEILQTGIPQLDQVIQVLLTTGMFVGGFLGFLLDNTIPGSREERGLLAWTRMQEAAGETAMAAEVYQLPWGIGTKFCTPSCARRLPFWPSERHPPAAAETRLFRGLAELTHKTHPHPRGVSLEKHVHPSPGAQHSAQSTGAPTPPTGGNLLPEQQVYLVPPGSPVAQLEVSTVLGSQPVWDEQAHSVGLRAPGTRWTGAQQVCGLQPASPLLPNN
ncbi:solute carrier family 23 member 1-like [Lepus europaeus]|uniref:solute carrier family 23 member 1-like n=1 Tax=Lepus europaeus TaxID=9983 RepID=UPI002B48C695|nr:solute carrier family 23 member 1-like [Lepus europaeus]